MTAARPVAGGRPRKALAGIARTKHAKGLVDRLVTPPRTARGRLTQATILSCATRLFREKGFHATTIDEIGALAGVSGPALYGHFASKDELLATLVYRSNFATAQLQDLVLADSLPPAQALDVLVGVWARHYVENRDVQAVAFQEATHLSDQYRTLILRLRGLLVAEWVALLAQLHPGISDEEARLRVFAAEGVLYTLVVSDSDLPDAALVDVMYRLTRCVLFEPLER